MKSFPLVIACFLYLILTYSLFAAEGDFKPAQSCAECHEKIHQQWSQSRHARSTVQKDPLFAAMYNWAIQDSQGKLKKKCIVCHSPMSTVFGDGDPEKSFNRDGITCQFCHGASEIVAYHSAKDIKIDLTTIYSSHPETRNDAHPVAHRDYFQKSDFCLPCHAEMKTPREIEVCSTGHEWKSYYEKTQKTCQDCHMPTSDDVPSHLFPGTHQGNLLQNAVSMSLSYLPESRKIQVTLINTGAGHALPTGTPLRMVILKVTALDENENPVWENWKDNPLREDKSALFMKILGNAEGKGPVPPWQATQVLLDRKLLPGTPVTVTYHLPENQIHKLKATLWYRFAPPPILKKFGITDPHFTEPRLMVQKEITLNKSAGK